MAVSLALPLYRGRATGVRVRFSCSCALLAGWLCLFGAASLLQARVERPFFQWSCLLPCEWRRLLRVEASGDALRVARKSDSLRLRWVYRIRRDRSPIAPLFVVPRHTHTHALLARCFAQPGNLLILLIEQIPGGPGPAGRPLLLYSCQGPTACKLTRMSLASPYMRNLSRRRTIL